MNEESLLSPTDAPQHGATLDWLRSLQRDPQAGEDLPRTVARLEAVTARLEAAEARRRTTALAWGFTGGFLGALCGVGLLVTLLT